MSTPTSLSSALAPPTTFLSVQDGTLCEFCRDDELIQPIRTRALSDLIQSSRYCELCARWLRALEHSPQNLKVRGQIAALRQHPLEQDVDDVTLVFLSSPERPKIAWPHIGHVWAALDTIDIDDAKDINLKPLPGSDQGETTWKSVREWLDRCDKHHKDCKHEKTSAWKPTRLLYVCNTQAALQVRLVESQDIPDGAEYLTLSHCPGAGSTLQLTRSNIEAFKSSIPVDELSRVFIDACNTAKRLSHDYLWIDALCIIQDDPADWQHGVGCMASTYGNSWLNVSADGDDEAGHGLFCPSDKRAGRPWYPVYIHREWGDGFPSNFCISEYHNWWERISDSELNRGVWALQERVLSPRVLHLGLEQVALECSSNAVCERLLYGDPTIRHDTAVLTSLKKFVLDARNRNLSCLTPENAFRNWNQVVQAYSQGQLTVATDKLIALSGLIDVLYPSFSIWWSQKIKSKMARGGMVHKLRWIHPVIDRQGFSSLDYGGHMLRDSWYGEQCHANIYSNMMETHLRHLGNVTTSTLLQHGLGVLSRMLSSNRRKRVRWVFTSPKSSIQISSSREAKSNNTIEWLEVLFLPWFVSPSAVFLPTHRRIGAGEWHETYEL
ncbi:hypothetical protein FOTG_13299 [Fusarium oxysporum f. sp. vasinfectum 25433]|uniref:Heterokaryon incompatibility domain-containing protein n=1 Tax=Fusarium oxysporum f. sp. vasinfectum 25433 TaxID=1089449 RepID=X0KY83_FUSOX|nr:hypothetical protein FOTG_13299 [Fusarium oxysporum f. sp. vasinfectum 25433]